MSGFRNYFLSIAAIAGAMLAHKGELPTIIALLMIWVADGTSGATHVGTFTSMEECKKATGSQEHVGPPENAPQYFFVCVRSK